MIKIDANGYYKLYEVYVQDEYNNNWWIGWYADLDDSIDDVNRFIIEEHLKLKKGELKEYPSPFGSGECFERELYDEEGHYYLICGFINYFANKEDYEDCKRIFVDTPKEKSDEYKRT